MNPEQRVRAEQLAKEQETGDIGNYTPDAIGKLIHELRVHQIELEMQNEELHRTEAALEAAHSKYFELYDLAPIAYLTIDGDGLIAEANLLAALLLGRTRANLVSLPFHSFVAHADQDIFYRFRRTPAHAHRDCELRIIRNDGPPRWIRMEASRVPSLEQENTLMKIAFSDITERKKATEQVSRFERLASLGALAGGVAHELNNPLAYVMGNLESLVKAVPPLLVGIAQLSDGEHRHVRLERAMAEKLIRRLQDAHEGSVRISGVTRALNTFLRFNSEASGPLQIQDAIESGLVLADNEIRHRARLVKNYAEVPEVVACKPRLSQVFLNLFLNAAQSIEVGNAENNEIRIRIWQDGGEICAEVRDTGKGIPKDIVESIFEPFFTTKQGSNGLGLGLSISKETVESLGGCLSVSSEVGKGTAFTVRLPVGPLLDREALTCPIPACSPSTTERRILVIDDDDAVRALMASTLEHHTTIQAESGARAMEILSQDQAFDIILCDLMMPMVSGAELHRWLKENHPLLAPRVVFVSGGVFTSNIRDYLAEQGLPCMEKPFKAEVLRQVIAQRVDELAAPQ